VYPVPIRCPVCGDELSVTRLVCGNCGTALEGRFALGKLFQLTSDQLHFVELFLRSEGKLNRVQEELGLSYPTVRNRLTEVIQCMGYDTSLPPADQTQQGEILERLARKEISSEEALALLQES